MVYYKLLFSCETKNVEAISTGGANYEWHISLVCSSCHTDINEIYFRGDDQVDVANSRGQCNFQMKCKTCAKMINITLEKFPDTVNVQEISKDIQIALFDCRGADPKSWNFQGLTVITPNGTVFNDADLTDTWVEYDEKAAEEVLIDKFKAYFQKSK
ncbi:unnamed protein product [Paramecium octaurelia]|uniref:Uncharacterized protein n=1 Tax=Paramecium octaurelia TaxID=43137 RepID=A0A8S1VP49_PAROT|nr:unnamed protein product [Paramecium octaurelia]